MSAMVKMQETRRVERRVTNWSGVARLGDLVVRGTVRDYTRFGLFFEPEVGWDGWFVQGGGVLDGLEVGDRVDITVMNRRDQPQCHMPATIRWMGASGQHQCQGFGVEFYQGA